MSKFRRMQFKLDVTFRSRITPDQQYVSHNDQTIVISIWQQDIVYIAFYICKPKLVQCMKCKLKCNHVSYMYTGRNHLAQSTCIYIYHKMIIDSQTV